MRECISTMVVGAIAFVNPSCPRILAVACNLQRRNRGHVYSRKFLITIGGGMLVLAACTSTASPGDGTALSTTLVAPATTIAPDDGSAQSSGTEATIESVTTIAAVVETDGAPSTTTIASTEEQGASSSTTISSAESDAPSVPDTVIEDPATIEAAFVPLELAAGTCFNDPDDDVDLVTPDDIPNVDCGSPHANEVYGSYDIGGDDYPGAASVHVQADGLCYDAFEGYVGTAYETSVYDFSWYFPTEESWPIGGTNIICFAYNADLTDITGSIENTGR